MAQAYLQFDFDFPLTGGIFALYPQSSGVCFGGKPDGQRPPAVRARHGSTVAGSERGTRHRDLRR